MIQDAKSGMTGHSGSADGKIPISGRWSIDMTAVANKMI